MKEEDINEDEKIKYIIKKQMSEQIEEVKIVGWSHKGLKIPDYEIKLDDPKSSRNFH